MDPELCQRLIQFLKPLYQDLDAVSRFDEVERISTIARQLHAPASEQHRLGFELLLLFQGLGGWLERVGNISRTVLVVGSGLTESDLRLVARSLRCLDAPETLEERALASALLIDRAGVRGLAGRFVQARREATSPGEVARELIGSVDKLPDWILPAARPWVLSRWEARRRFCEQLLAESSLEDLV